ncbi:MAG: prepilin-type N-terminal cleavage/methylation domain-containing protein [Oscillospiraceae bacterium]|nr:prepilin-type N-terminal cleavage/methylation domain-containing protein [Oscillospiraceae bacterium]
MKTKKGMTLIEIVISMGVYAVIALLVVRIMMTVNAVMNSTNQLNDRLSYEAKYADNVQVNDDAGHSFSFQRVDYEIVYDIRNDGNGKRINSSGTSGARDYAAYEYTVDTLNSDAQILGQDMHSNVNYRFMTFNKVPVATPERTSDTFTVVFRPVAYFSGKYGKAPGSSDYNAQMAAQFEDNMTDAQKTAAITSANSSISKFNRVVATGTNFKGSGSETIVDKGVTGMEMVLNKDYPVLVNHAPDVADMPATTTKYPGTINYSVTKNGTVYSTGSATYYMYVKYGSEATSVVYYNSVVIEYNVNTGALNPLKSE